jgi:hypothetical protein
LPRRQGVRAGFPPRLRLRVGRASLLVRLGLVSPVRPLHLDRTCPLPPCSLRYSALWWAGCPPCSAGFSLLMARRIIFLAFLFSVCMGVLSLLSPPGIAYVGRVHSLAGSQFCTGPVSLSSTSVVGDTLILTVFVTHTQPPHASQLVASGQRVLPFWQSVTAAPERGGYWYTTWWCSAGAAGGWWHLWVAPAGS